MTAGNVPSGTTLPGMGGSGLGEFLTARRALVDPALTGLALGGGRRRVTGLRREEVAVLAGVSVDYYRRLEQGRERHPSPGVLESLSRVLHLDGNALAHLCRLAGSPVVAEAVPPNQRVSAHLRDLLDAWLHQPAFVLGPALGLLAVNPLATALFSGFEPADNLVRMSFLDPHSEIFFRDSDRARRSCVASLRQTDGTTPDDPRVAEVVAELLEVSPQFAALWARHDVYSKTAEIKHMHHPTVGALTLTSQAFDVRGAPGQQLIVYSAPLGSTSAHSLALLGSLSADGPVSSASGTDQLPS